ncbi:hypothetical protein, partial [Chitinimonas sp.]|uniref:hypothetical protein n=1 Tax=Chitinimonas sp. TaxID=1934313 RepID=UPI0035B4BF79
MLKAAMACIALCWALHGQAASLRNDCEATYTSSSNGTGELVVPCVRASQTPGVELYNVRMPTSDGKTFAVSRVFPSAFGAYHSGPQIDESSIKLTLSPQPLVQFNLVWSDPCRGVTNVRESMP